MGQPPPFRKTELGYYVGKPKLLAFLIRYDIFQWRSQKFGLGGAVGHIWLKSSIVSELF